MDLAGVAFISVSSPVPSKRFKRRLPLNQRIRGRKNGLGRALMALGKMDEAEKVLLEATNDTIEHFGEAQAVKMQVTAGWFGLIQFLLATERRRFGEEEMDRSLSAA